jgi:hypothetical protein
MFASSGERGEPCGMPRQLVARLCRARLPASIVGFFDGAVQPHLDQMQHAPINETQDSRP